MTYYIDTSALAKVYHPESGFEYMRLLYKGNDAIRVSELTRVESVSVTRRKVLAGEISAETQHVFLERFAEDLKSRYEVLRLTSGVLDEAARLLGPGGVSVSLRSLDAIQFAAFKLLCAEDAIFVCSDKRLAAVAESQGRKVLDPAAP